MMTPSIEALRERHYGSQQPGSDGHRIDSREYLPPSANSAGFLPFCEEYRVAQKKAPIVLLGLTVEFIPNAVNRMDDVTAGKLFGDLLADIFNMGVDGAVIAFKLVALHLVQQFTA